jgi:hypothetical protein
MKLGSNKGVFVLSALIRCMREDDKAAPLFEQIHECPGLWVFEFVTPAMTPLPDWENDAIEPDKTL